MRFLLLFAALWLPVQTMAALSVPACRHAQEQGAAKVADDHAGMAMMAGEGGMPCHDLAADPVAHDGGCDNCGTCHLAGAGFMPSAAVAAGMIPAGRHYVMPAIAMPPSHVAETPRHPPRRAA